MPEIKFELAPADSVKLDREATQTVEVLTDMIQRCSRCEERVTAEPCGLTLVDVVDSKGLHEAQQAVAVAMYKSYNKLFDSNGREFEALSWERQSTWLREAAKESWSQESFSLDGIGRGLSPQVRAAGIKEAKKWPAYTDRRKVFRVSSAKFPPGWLHLSFEARGSKDGQPVQHTYVTVHICPKCALVVFDAANVNPVDPFGDGSKW